MERRLAAILAADVAGYSRLVRADEEGTLAALKAVLGDLVAPGIDRHNGRIVKLMGDGVLAEFASVVDAVCAGAEIQRAMADHNARGAEDRRIEFRMGINLGDVVIDGDDIQGDGVNIAARLEGLAETGGICISGAVHEQVRDRVDLAFEDVGDREVKNIDRPVRVWRWVRDAAAPPPEAVAPRETKPLPDKPSIVVLPFDNMSGDAEQEYFSDGISEDIITDLSKVSGLFVIARNSAFVYKGKGFNVADVCRELGVRFAVEGSVRKAGNRVRVTAQLIDGSSGGHLWAERYDRDLTDIFEVQDDVTQQIVAALKVTLSETEKTLIVGGGTKDVGAHDLFLKGRALMFGTKRDREMFERSMPCFRGAIGLDPNYAGAYAGLGMGYALDHQNHWSEAPETSLDRAQRLVDDAIDKDDNDPFVHYVAAVVATWKKDYERWAHEDEKALSLNPNYALAHSNLGPASSKSPADREVRITRIEAWGDMSTSKSKPRITLSSRGEQISCGRVSYDHLARVIAFTNGVVMRVADSAAPRKQQLKVQATAVQGRYVEVQNDPAGAGWDLRSASGSFKMSWEAVGSAPSGRRP